MPGAPDELSAPHRAERVVRLGAPLTPARLGRACEACGFSKPSRSIVAGVLGAQRWTTSAPRSFGTLGETLEIELVSPLEVVLRSAARAPGVPVVDWRKNESNVDALARALGAL